MLGATRRPATGMGNSFTLSAVVSKDLRLLKRVLIIDAHPLMREALRSAVLSVRPKAHTVEVGSLAAVDDGCRFGATMDLAIIDPALPGATGLSVLISVQQRLPHTPILIFSGRCDDQIVASSRALGAAGFVHKSAGTPEMADALRVVLDGGIRFPALTGALSASHDLAALRRRLDGLTNTQMKVLLNIADGRLNKQVAADLQVTEAAIKGHLTVIFRKLGVQNRAQALLALRPFLDDSGSPLA